MRENNPDDTNRHQSLNESGYLFFFFFCIVWTIESRGAPTPPSCRFCTPAVGMGHTVELPSTFWDIKYSMKV